MPTLHECSHFAAWGFMSVLPQLTGLSRPSNPILMQRSKLPRKS